MRISKTENKARVVPNERDASLSAVLSFGYAQPGLKKKHDVLSKMGFSVKSIAKFEEAKTLITRKGDVFRLLLIGHMVPRRERRVISDLYRKHSPHGSVIFFYRGSISNAEGATVLLSEERSPENLIDAIHVLQTQLSASAKRGVRPPI